MKPEEMAQAEIAQVIGQQALQIATLKAQLTALQASLPAIALDKSPKPRGKSTSKT